FDLLVACISRSWPAISVMEVVKLAQKVESNFFSIFGFLINILFIPRAAITIVAQAEFFNQEFLECRPGDNSTAQDSIKRQCYDLFATTWPPHYHWFTQIGLSIAVLVFFYFPSWWTVKHQKRQSKNIARGYLLQTVIRTAIEFSFFVSQGVVYGFQIAGTFSCVLNSQRIPCDVLRVNGRIAMLVAMFAISIAVMGLHVADLIRTIRMLKSDDRSLLPVLDDE
ncbi:unnamed protein product, partial [Owenia fusiformis]